MKFSIVTVRVPDPRVDRHTRALDEVRVMLLSALPRLGHQVASPLSYYVAGREGVRPELWDKWPDDGSVPIVLNAGLLGYERPAGFVPPPVPEEAVLYNWENLSSPLVGEMMPLFRSRRVWESSRARQRVWNDSTWLGGSAIAPSRNAATVELVPFGWVPELESEEWDSDESEKLYDVLFCGSMSDRRRAVLKSIMETGAKVRVATADDPLYGTEQRRTEGRSRVVLNLKYADDYETPELRPLAALSRGAFVVTEPGPRPLSGPGLVPVEIDRMAEEVSWWLRRPRERACVAMIGRERLREMRPEPALEEAIRKL